ncbi:MAG: hypothetical protein PHW90_01680 [Bacilli bacterium]|nr:hypothetical protein [Bacilli bacterium]
MNTNARKVTNDVISAVEDGFLSWEEVAKACLNYMSEDDVEDMARLEDWSIWLEDEEDEEEDEEDNTIMKRLTAFEEQKIYEIADRYVTSSPVSGKWETEAIHERDAIAKELRLTKEEANEVMVEYLGFDIEDLESEELTEKKVEKKITTEEVINTAKKYGLTFTEEALKDLEGNVATLNYLRESDEWMEAKEMFKKDINWKKHFRESLTEEVCPDCGKELEKDGHCYNEECVAYDPTSQYFDENPDIEFEDEETDTLSEEEALSMFKKGGFLFINNNDGYTAIVSRNGLNDEKAYTSIDYDLGQKLIDRYDLKLLDRKGPNYNQEIYVYKGKLNSLPQKRTFSLDDFDENFDIEFEDEEEDDGTLLNTDYDKLNFHDEGFLIGEMDLHYPEVSVLNMFDDDIFVEIDLSINVEPEVLLQYICDRNYIDREDLTVVEAQKFIDDIARTPDDYKDYLLEFYYEEAEIEAFKKADLEPNYFSDRRYTEMKENLDEIESMLEQNDFEIDFYNGHLTGDVELYYDDLIIIGDEIPSGDPYEPSDWEEIELNYVYTADVDQSTLVDYVLDRFKLDGDISNIELQKYIDKIESNKEFLAYHNYLKEQFREKAEEQAFYEEAGKEDDFDDPYER